jgi:hypothetical protein
MEGHAEMDMSVTEGTLWQRLTSESGYAPPVHMMKLTETRARRID